MHQEFREIVSRSGFLMDWQKEKMLAMLPDDSGGDDSDDDDSGLPDIGDRVIPVIDNVLWRTMGVSLDSLPPMDRRCIEHAVREVI